MFLNKDQLSGAAKANFESQFGLYAEFTRKSLESFEKLMTLNLTATRASMDEAAQTARQMMTAKDPQEFMSLAAAQAKPNMDKAVAYSGHLANIAVTMQSEFNKLAEAQITGIGQRVTGFVEQAAKNAPAGSENMAAFVKSAFSQAASGYEQFQRGSKQATDAFGANVTAASSPIITETTSKA